MTQSVEEFLAHTGVLGMHWGQRRAEKILDRKEKDREIIASRIRTTNRARTLDSKAALTYTATSKKGQELATKSFEKYANHVLNHKDTKMASMMTHGEKVANGISLGVLGAIVAGAIAVSYH